MNAASATSEWTTRGWFAAATDRAPLGPLVLLAGLLSSRALAKRTRSKHAGLVSQTGGRDEAKLSPPSGPEAGGSGDFGELFRAYRADVERVCRRMLGEGHAQDAASEVFLRAQRALEAYDPERPFRPWLLGIASHHCIDQLRRRTRETRLFEADDLSELRAAHPGPSPLRQLAQREQRKEVLDAIDTLPHKYRLPIVLRFYEELDYAGIAEILGVERGQVGTLLFRAKQRLRDELATDEEEVVS